MSIADQIQSIARQEYQLLRAFAKAVDERLEPAVSNSPGLSTALVRVRDALREFDNLVAGADHARSGPTATAETKPVPRPAPKPSAAEPAADPVATHATDDQAEVEHLAEEFLEDEGEHHTGELAENEDLRDVQARLRAKHAVQEQHEQHDQNT